MTVLSQFFREAVLSANFGLNLCWSSVAFLLNLCVSLNLSFLIFFICNLVESSLARFIWLTVSLRRSLKEAISLSLLAFIRSDTFFLFLVKPLNSFKRRVKKSNVCFWQTQLENFTVFFKKNGDVLNNVNDSFVAIL